MRIVSLFLIIFGCVLAVIRERRIGDYMWSGPIRPSIPRTGLELFYEGNIGYILSVVMVIVGVVLLLFEKFG